MGVTPALVETAWLAERLDRPGIAVLDASWFMPAEKRNPAAEFVAGRIPGARRFDIDAVADPDSKLPHMAPSPARFALMMSELGLNDDDHAVFYDRHGVLAAARGWWLMRLFGHDRVSVLNGGLPAWRREDRLLASGVTQPVTAGRFTARLRPELVRDLAAMRANLVSGAEVVLDARGVGRFLGTEPEPRAGLPGGHIPGSRSLPHSELLGPDQRMLAPEVLRDRFAAVMPGDPSVPVVTTCGSGVSASVLALGLAVAGLPDGAVYDGSWTEWASDPTTPKER